LLGNAKDELKRELDAADRRYRELEQKHATEIDNVRKLENAL
jgi:hypothetical protein